MLSPVPEELFRYLIVIHFFNCVVLLTQQLTVGLYPFKELPKQIFILIVFCLGIPLVQLGLSIIRIWCSYSPGFSLDDPLYGYLDFIWSPMFTIVILWVCSMYLSRTYTKALRHNIGTAIIAPIKAYYMLVATALGWFTNFICNILFTVNFNILLSFYILIAFSSYCIEFALYPYINNGKINLTTYTVFWFIGTWLYYIYI